MTRFKISYLLFITTAFSASAHAMDAIIQEMGDNHHQLHQQVQHHHANLNVVMGDVGNLNNQHQALNNQVVGHGQQINNLAQQANGHNQDINNLQQQVGGQGNLVQQHGNHIHQLLNDQQAQDQNINLIQQQVQQHANDHQNYIQQLLAQIQQLNGQVQQKDQQLQDRDQQVAHWQNAHHQQHDQVNLLNDQLNQLNLDHQVVRDDREALRIERTNLNHRIALVTGEKDALVVDKANLTNQVTAVSRQRDLNYQQVLNERAAWEQAKRNLTDELSNSKQFILDRDKETDELKNALFKNQQELTHSKLAINHLYLSLNSIVSHKNFDAGEIAYHKEHIQPAKQFDQRFKDLVFKKSK